MPGAVPGFQPPAYPAAGMAAGMDIPALLASMGLEAEAAPKPKVAKEPKKEPKKEVPKRAELGALSFSVPAQKMEAPRPAPGLPLPFQDVSNIQALPSPSKSPKFDSRRASPAIPEQENPQNPQVA